MTFDMSDDRVKSNFKFIEKLIMGKKENKKYAGHREEKMAVKKIMGTETEYGIITSGAPIVIDSRGEEDFESSYRNVRAACQLLLNSFPKKQARLLKPEAWDYTLESPMRDARGEIFTHEEEERIRRILVELERKYGKVRKGLPDENFSDIAKILREHIIAVIEDEILVNGARFYIDHVHPEYSTPECTNARDVVIWERAGERILNLSMIAANQFLPGGQEIVVYKDNTDRKGNTYGSHENYLISRACWNAGSSWRDMPILRLIPFLVTRQIFCGSGKIGIEKDKKIVNPYIYQISQRADFMEAEMSVSTTLTRPIINTRDEPHADPAKYHRLHLILGDANMSEWSIFLKLGTTAIVLQMIEDGFITEVPEILNPVSAIKSVSRDLTCRRPVLMRNGEKMTAVEIQRWYLNKAKEYAQANPDAVDKDALEAWEETVEKIAEDPRLLARKVDWMIKKELLEAELARREADWSDYHRKIITIGGEEEYLSERLKMIELQYHDIRPEYGLYYLLESCGEVDRLTKNEEIENAMFYPPEDTRAFFRGHCIRKFREAIVAANWDCLVFNCDPQKPLERIRMIDPAKGTKALTGELINSCRTALDLILKIKSKTSP